MKKKVELSLMVRRFQPSIISLWRTVLFGASWLVSISLLAQASSMPQEIRDQLSLPEEIEELLPYPDLPPDLAQVPPKIRKTFMWSRMPCLFLDKDILNSRIEKAMQKTSSENLRERVVGLQLLGLLLAEKYRDYIAKFLNDPDPRIKAVAAEALGDLQADAYVKEIKAIENHESIWVKFAVSWTLAVLGSESYPPSPEGTSWHRPSIRMWAEGVFGN